MESLVVSLAGLAMLQCQILVIFQSVSITAISFLVAATGSKLWSKHGLRSIKSGLIRKTTGVLQYVLDIFDSNDVLTFNKGDGTSIPNHRH